MSNKTWKDRVQTYLESLGYTITPTKTDKYTALASKDKDRFYFLGSYGAVRTANNNKITEAISVTEMMHKRVEEWEKTKNEPTQQA